MALFLMVTHGSDGDVLPFVGLGAALAQAGHRAVLLTHGPYRAVAEGAGLGFAAIDGEAEFESVLADTPGLLGSAPHLAGWAGFYRRNALFEQIAAECRTLAELHVPGGTVLVGRHTSAVSVRFAAELLRAPVAWVALAPTQLLAVPVAAYLYGAELAAGMQEVRAGLGLPEVPDWRAWFAGADAELGLWPGWFDAAGPRAPARVALTGFPLADASARALGARPSGPSDPPGDPSADPSGDPFDGLFPAGARPVLATGGTGRMLAADYYPALLAAAGRTGLPTLLVVRHRDLLPDVLPDNVRWSPGLDFARAVPHAAAVVHHGGIGTLARALAAGTPQVLMADGVDRPDNAARLSRLGLARAVPADRWRTPELAAAIGAAAADHDLPLRAAAVTGPQRPQEALDAAAARLAGLLTGPPRPRAHDLSPAERARLRERLRERRAAGAPVPGEVR
ncbi:glycosyltransferase [Kitasatospora phosalacinea]|uniref:glycosyltransferase n=1 Tax=Kitasatospora phosalacinea TaxID=2065 RepID=UPI000526B4C6|nr:nucleotide disphospho-sugar-binding domain-containing protein [Kitasatospora phosalacinea]